MPSPELDLRDRKLIRMFEILDTDKDGVVRELDCINLGRELGDALAAAKDAVSGGVGTALGAADASVHRAELAATITEIWEGYRSRADVKDNVKMTADDFVTVMRIDLKSRPDKVLQLVGVLTNLIFEMVDLDNDGQITREESIDLTRRVLRFTEAGATRAWEIVDAKNAGRLSYGTVLRATTTYITSEDPTAPENGILGPL